MGGQTRQDPRIGTNLAGYRIETLLGRGGMSVVYLAEDTRLGRKVALKLLAPELAEDERFRERFLRESKLAASIDHSNVIPIYEAGETDGLLFIAMRYVEGTDLRELLLRERQLEPARAVALASQIADALDAAHEHGLVHRDVKPGNVLIARQGGREHCYLADFGLTKQSASDTGLTGTEQFVGTPDYVAPELIEREPADGHADQYSLACLLYECLTGETPYRGESLMGTLWAHVNDPPPTVTQKQPDLPEAIDHVIARGMAKNPADRYPTCHQLVQDAQDTLGVSTAGPAAQTRARTVALLMLALALVLIAAAITAGILLTRGEGTIAKPHAPSTRPTLAITAGSIQRIDPKTNKLIATIAMKSDPTGVAVGEGAVWTAQFDSSSISKIEPHTNLVGKTVHTGPGLRYLAAGLGSVWVVVSQDDAISQIDPATVSLSHTINFSPRWGADLIAVGEGALWVVMLSGGIARINPTGVSIGNGNAALVATIYTGQTIIDGIAIGSGGVWFTDSDNVTYQRAGRIDPESNELVETIPLEGGAFGIAAGAGAVWVTNPLDDVVSRIDPTTNRVATRIKVGDDPIAIAAGEGAVWAANYNDGTVSRIDPATNEVVETIEVGRHPDHIAAGMGGVWVTVHAR